MHSGLLGVAWTLALAGPSTPDTIHWTAPASCPDDAELERRIAAYVDVSNVTTVAEATVRGDGTGFVVDLVRTIGSEVETRALTAPTCETLAEAVAVVVALGIEPALDEPPAVAMPQPAIERPSTQPELSPAGRGEPPREEATSRRPLEIGLRLGPGYGTGIAPRGSGLVGVALSVGRRPWSVELEGRFWLPRTFEATTADHGARVLLGTIGAVACLRPPTRAVEIPLCLGAEGGSERVSPRGLIDGRTRSFPWVAAVARVGLRVRLGAAVGVLLAAEGAVPMVRAGLDVGGTDRLWTNRSVSIRALAGLEFRWVR